MYTYVIMSYNLNLCQLYLSKTGGNEFITKNKQNEDQTKRS